MTDTQSVVTAATSKTRVNWPARGRKLGLILGSYALILLVWEWAVDFFQMPTYILAGPSEIWREFIRGILSGSFARAFGVTATEALMGMALGVLFGFILATLFVEFRMFETIVYPLFMGFESVPKIALAPLIIVWVGFGIESKVIISAMVALFPVVINTMVGMRSYPKELDDLFDVLHASRWERFYRLRMRACAPSFFSGLRLAFIFAMLGAIVGEFLSSEAGLGYLLLQFQAQLNIAGTFAVLAVLSIFGFTGERIINWVGRKLTWWATA